jgi:hypothetical protein
MDPSPVKFNEFPPRIAVEISVELIAIKDACQLRERRFAGTHHKKAAPHAAPCLGLPPDESRHSPACTCRSPRAGLGSSALMHHPADVFVGQRGCRGGGQCCSPLAPCRELSSGPTAGSPRLEQLFHLSRRYKEDRGPAILCDGNRLPPRRSHKLSKPVLCLAHCDLNHRIHLASILSLLQLA